eukprot:SAG11_NODE_20115_length_452_cov_1.172805_2_plen_62_part_01
MLVVAAHSEGALMGGSHRQITQMALAAGGALTSPVDAADAPATILLPARPPPTLAVWLDAAD